MIFTRPIATVCLAASFLLVILAIAAGYPTREIEWHNPLGLGTVAGMAMRVAADAAEKYLGQSKRI